MSSGPEFSENEMQIVRLAQDGLSPIEIKAALGRSTPGSISAILSRARKQGILSTTFRSGSGVHLTARMHDYLALEAEERGIGTHDLIRLILKNVIDDDLFSAVLDK